MIRRDRQGEVLEVRWQDLLRRWSMDYSVTETNRALMYIAPRGLTQVRDQLRRFNTRYALTSHFAVPKEAQVASSRILTCYVENGDQIAAEIDLRPTDAGANVLLLEAFDSVVYDRTRETEELTTVALPQCVVDLLTGSGREPAEAEALMTWMVENEHAWRA